MLRLTPKNQRQRLAEDAERVRRGRMTDFSIGQHVELLIARVVSLEMRLAAAEQADIIRHPQDIAEGGGE